MTEPHTLRDLLHRATHRLPGVPTHTGRPTGHQGRPRHGHAPGAPRPSWNHSPARAPRVLVAWQRRIAALFGQELR